MESYADIWLRTFPGSYPESTTANDTPNYWVSNPRSLITISNVTNLHFGPGDSIYTKSILPAIASASSEVILVTCFWAHSSTLTSLNATLIDLSAKALRNGKKIRVRICFSSFSLFQKLFHTSSLKGRTYHPDECHRSLGLPPSNELEGLDVEVKSIFVRPFSVMHPKFVIIDRQQVFLPSCNVSWEDWFEGCVELSGAVVRQFMEFWLQFWAGDQDRIQDFELADEQGAVDFSSDDVNTTKQASTPQQHSQATLLNSTRPFQPKYAVPSIFLPSPHHQNPKCTLLPWRPCIAPPRTPLNMFLISAFQLAQKHIYLQTPNLTAPIVLQTLLNALERGVDVTILTSERLMILEQLLTAGTTTKRCIRKLVKRHKQLLRDWNRGDVPAGDLEAGYVGIPHRNPGRLQIYYYHPYAPMSSKGKIGGIVSEPTQSHLKLTIVDGIWTILGSGNMDRASWYTSQELSLAFFSEEFAADVRKLLDPLMECRRKLVYGGGLTSQETTQSS